MQSPPSATSLRRFEILARDEPALIVRVAGLCLRRCAPVVALEVAPADEAHVRLSLAVRVDERHGRTLRARIESLVEVLSALEHEAEPALAG